VHLSATISNLRWGRDIAPVPSNNSLDAFRLGQFETQALEVSLILGTREVGRGCPRSHLCNRTASLAVLTHENFNLSDRLIVLQMGTAEGFVEGTWDGGDAPSPPVGQGGSRVLRRPQWPAQRGTRRPTCVSRGFGSDPASLLGLGNVTGLAEAGCRKMLQGAEEMRSLRRVGM
jgi:hypothetical protein